MKRVFLAKDGEICNTEEYCRFRDRVFDAIMSMRDLCEPLYRANPQVTLNLLRWIAEHPVEYRKIIAPLATAKLQHDRKMEASPELI